MSENSGYAVKAAVKRPVTTSSYGTEAATPTNQIPLISESMKVAPVLVRSDALVGQAAGAADVDLVRLDCSGSISCELWWEGLEYLLFAAFGYEDPDQPAARSDTLIDQGGSPATDGTSSYLHIYELDDSAHREGFTTGEWDTSIPATDYAYSSSYQKVRAFSLWIRRDTDGNPEHFVDCMVNKCTFRGSIGKPITVDFDLVARSMNKDDDGNAGNWALPSDISGAPRFANMTQTKCYINSSNNATFSTEYGITDFEIMIDNGLKVDDVDTGQSAGGLHYLTEPVRSKPRVVTMKLKFARYDAANAALQSALGASTELQSLIQITGPSTGGSYPYSIEFAIPTMKCVKADFPVGGPGVISGDAEFVAYKSPAAYHALTWMKDFYGGIQREKLNELVLAVNNTRKQCFSRDANTPSLP